MNKKDTINPRWIKLKEATQYGAIGKGRLIRLAQEGIIKGAPDPDNKRNDWIFDRLSIDAYREAQMPYMTRSEEVRILLDDIHKRSKK